MLPRSENSGSEFYCPGWDESHSKASSNHAYYRYFKSKIIISKFIFISKADHIRLVKKIIKNLGL